MKKTNAMRLLDRQKIAYRTASYEVDLDDLSAVAVSKKLDIEPERLLKTLLVRGAGGCHFAVIPTHTELDLKSLAQAAGEKKISVVPLKEVQSLTGYVRGGVTVLGAKKAFPAFLDRSALEYAEVSVSAGMRGQQILLAPDDYVRATGATVADIATPMESG